MENPTEEIERLKLQVIYLKAQISALESAILKLEEQKAASDRS